MILEYFKFFINGGILGLVAWWLQLQIYGALSIESGYAYALASALTYLPLVVVNFMVQRAWIFKERGLFQRFIVANLAIMLLVSAWSPFCRQALDWVVGSPWGDRGGFILAALLGSVPSFVIKRHWVFGKKLLER